MATKAQMAEIIRDITLKLAEHERRLRELEASSSRNRVCYKQHSRCHCLSF